MNIHYMPRALVERARSRAAGLGFTLKEWIISLITKALSSVPAAPRPRPDIDPLAPGDTVTSSGGRRDLPPPNGGQHE